MKLREVLGLAALAASAPLAAQASLITNGDFATPVIGGSFASYSGGSTAITGWTVTGDSVDLIGTYWQAPPGGGQSVDLSGLNAGGVTQTLATTIGMKYRITFELSGNPDGAPSTKTLTVAAGPTSADYTYTTGANSHADMGYAAETFLFTAQSTLTALSFTSDDNTAYGPVVGNLAGSAVPEPLSLAILGTGLIGLCLVRRRNAIA